MKTQTKNVFDAALALSESDRALLAKKLFKSLRDDQPELSDPELAAELDRRFAEYQKDPSKAVPWSKLKQQS